MKFLAFALLLVTPAAYAQESALGAEFRKEGEGFKESCSGFSFGKIGSCAELLFTGHPLHIAAGSLAPQNGIGVGGALVTHWTPNEKWRFSLDVDAVVSTNQSWRAGAYMTAMLVPRRIITPGPGGGPPDASTNIAPMETPVFHLYAQGISLNKVAYFGLGPNTSDTARTYFGMRETITGGDVLFPIFKKIRASLWAEANGRFVEIRGSYGQGSPSIETRFNDVTAPGIASQPAFAQFGEGIRLRPVLGPGVVRLNYFVNYKQFVAGNSVNSFQRFTVDLGHQIPLYKTTRSLLAKDGNGPDDCMEDPSLHKCPAVSRNLEGSFGFRFLLSQSQTGDNHVVPFYFQHTLGGSDIDGANALGSFQDYRFRAPNLMLLRGSFEHSLPGRFAPLGVAFQADAGKLAMQASGLSDSRFVHSYSAGLTLRAGGFPLIYLMFSWGGGEGTHTTAAINNSLLGGGARPSLY